jgi:serine/threonine protein kinase
MNYGRYQIVKELGRGSMGVVYQAYDPQFDRSIALKVMRQDRVTSDAYVKRFLKEARAIGRLSHYHIVTAYDAGEDQGTIFLAMEFVEGRPLNEVMQERKFTFDEIMRLGIQVAETLDYAQQKGVVHRDIKPSNIILQPGDVVKITDFGIAHIEDVSATLQTQDGEVLGTPAYMSPEQVLGKSVDGRSDLFSLGIILYEMSTGERPFGRASKNIATVFNDIVHTEPTDPTATNPGMEPALARVILKCLNKDPDQRYQTGKELADAIQNCLKEKDTQTQVLPPTPPEPPKEVKPRKRGIPPMLLILPIILVVGLAAAYFYRAQIMALFASKTAVIQVQSNPQGADVYVDGEMKGKTPSDLKLPFGTHSVRMSLSGYQDWEDQVQLDQPGQFPLKADLKPAAVTASLSVSTTPPGAEVFLDGASKGKTPLLASLPLGKHHVKLTLPGYRAQEQDIELSEAREYPLQVALQAVPSLAQLKLSSTPPGAEVFIDGTSKGKTPTDLELPLGDHTVRMSLPDYEGWEKQLNLPEAKEYPVAAELKPVPKLASLKVRSTPPGADVLVDGTSKGKTPLDMMLPPGEHTVQMSLAEHQKWENRIQLPETGELNVDLKPLVAERALQLTSTPAGAQVFVDGKPQGQTPVTLKMKSGAYMVKVHLPEYQDWTKRVEIKDQDLSYNADLKQLPKEAFLNATSTPRGAAVYVDGRRRGTTPVRLSVPPGPHKVRLTLGGYEDWETRVDVRQAEESAVDAMLSRVARRTTTGGATGGSTGGSSGGGTGGNGGWIIKAPVDK